MSEYFVPAETAAELLQERNEAREGLLKALHSISELRQQLGAQRRYSEAPSALPPKKRARRKG